MNQQARTDRGSSGPAAAGRRGDLGKSKRARRCGAAAGGDHPRSVYGLNSVHPQVCALLNRTGKDGPRVLRTRKRLAGEEILESPNVLDAAELLRVGTTRG